MPFSAQWIWKSKEPRVCKEALYFRKSFTINNIEKTEICVSADSRYRLYINGIYIATGPQKGDRFRKYYDVLDVTAYLRQGSNTVAAEVLHYPNDYRGAMNFHTGPISLVNGSRGGFWLECTACPQMNTNTEWLCCDNVSRRFVEAKQSKYAGDMEEIDGAAALPCWCDPKAPEDAFSPCVVVAPPDNARLGGVLYEWQLTKRDIPLLYERPIQPIGCTKSGGDAELRPLLERAVTVPPHCTAFVDIDMGELVNAYVRLSMETSAAGGCVTLCYGECYQFLGHDGLPVKRVRDDANGDIFGEEDTYYVGQGTQVYEPFEFRVFRYLRLTVKTKDVPVTLTGLSFRLTGYPLKKTGGLTAADPTVQRLWDVSVRTLERCMLDTYVDCPYYEQMQYTMDTLIQAQLTYPLSADDRLIRRALYDFHSTLRPDGLIAGNAPAAFDQLIPVFALYFVDLVGDHYRYFGDVTLVRQYLPTIMRILDYFGSHTDPSDGLVGDVGYWNFVDWVDAWRGNHGCPLTGENDRLYIYSLVYAYALRRAVELFCAAGMEAQCKQYLQQYQQLTDRAKQLIRDPMRGYYRTHKNEAVFSQHAQVWAVLSGCAEGEEAKQLMRACMQDSNLLKCSYSMQFFLFRALELAGVYDEFPEKWAPWRRLLEQHVTTWPEDFVNQRSDCHGWSAVPLYELVHVVLGIRPDTPGFASLVIAPQDTSLGDISGSVATPRGLIRVRREVAADGKVTCVIRLPEPIPTRVVLPDTEDKFFCQEEIVFSYYTNSKKGRS